MNLEVPTLRGTKQQVGILPQTKETKLLKIVKDVEVLGSCIGKTIDARPGYGC